MLPTLRLTAAALMATLALGASAADPANTGVQARAKAEADAEYAAKGQALTRAAMQALAQSHWLADGRDDAPRKIYVFTDANCPFCTKFWSDARPWVDSGKVQLRHILVAVISPSSAGKAATILSDADPARRLSTFERARAFNAVRMMAGGQHPSLDDPSLLPLDPIPPAIGQEIKDHDQMMLDLGIGGTPGIVFSGADGQLVIKSGLPPQELKLVLGPL